MSFCFNCCFPKESTPLLPTQPLTPPPQKSDLVAENPPETPRDERQTANSFVDVILSPRDKV